MVVTTSFNVEGRNISEYLGIVAAAQVMVLTGGNKTVQIGWQVGVAGATETLMKQALALGADAVISAKFKPFGSNICATGTAVKLD